MNWKWTCKGWCVCMVSIILGILSNWSLWKIRVLNLLGEALHSVGLAARELFRMVLNTHIRGCDVLFCPSYWKERHSSFLQGGPTLKSLTTGIYHVHGILEFDKIARIRVSQIYRVPRSSVFIGIYLVSPKLVDKILQ